MVVGWEEGQSKGYLEVALLGEGLSAFAEFADPVGALVAGDVGLFVSADVGGLREGLGALGAFVGAEPGVAVLVGLGGVRGCCWVREGRRLTSRLTDWVNPRLQYSHF